MPEDLGIMRTNKQIHAEVDKHCFDRNTLLVKACRTTQRGATQRCFANDTSVTYANRYMSIMRTEIGRRITHLEIQILPTEESLQDSLRGNFEFKDNVSLRQICSFLPNLRYILCSYPKPDPKKAALINGLLVRAKEPQRSKLCKGSSLYNHKNGVTLEWIRDQLWLPQGSLRILWDLTYFRESVEDLQQLRKDIFCERFMKEMIQENGRLKLAKSAAATKEDLARWPKIESALLSAIEKSYSV